VLTLILLSLSLQLTEPGVAGSFSSHTRGVRWDFNLTHATLDQSPDWTEADEWPPLSPKRAIELAWQQLGTLVGDTEGWRFDSISLKQFGPKRKWIYVVEIDEPPPRADGGIHSSIKLVVLLDGTTVAPVRRPRPEPAR
jgi:hypothetical protein